jgi:hypothetical protein
MAKLLFLIILLNVMVVPAAAQEEVTVEPLSEFLGISPQYLRNAVVSPDAAMLAWSDEDGLCIYTFANETTDCTAFPELYRGQEPMTWSPDGAYLAFTENFFVQLREPDIWLFDVEARMFFNRTDDGQIGGILREPEGDRPRYIDTLPTWHPMTGDLYFFRSQDMELFGDDIRTTQLMRIPAEDVPVWAVEPEEFANLTIQFELPWAIYNPSYYTLNGAVAFSPDGTQLAMLVRPNELDSPDWGLWVLSLEDLDLDRLATVEELNLGRPEWVDRPLFPDGLAWAGENLIVSLYSPVDLMFTNHAVYVDTEAGEITPLLDFQGIEQPDFVSPDPETGVPPAFELPRSSVLTPDGKTLLYLNIFEGVGGLSGLVLPPTGDELTRWWETEPTRPYQSIAPSAGESDSVVRVITGGFLVTYGE